MIRSVSNLALAFAVLMAMSRARAANPSFSSFNTNQFATNTLLISFSNPAQTTNFVVVSNLYSQTIFTTNIYTTNLFATNIFNNNLYTTNVFATNLYVTNIFNDITFNGRVTFNTNVTFVTNLITSTLYAPGTWTNAFITNVLFTNVTAGTFDIYTIPSGKRASLVSGSMATTNAAGGTHFFSIKTNAVTYRLTSATSLSAGTNSPVTLANPGIIYEEGETLVGTTSLTGANVRYAIWLYPNTVPIYSPRIVAPTGGSTPQLLHTATAGVETLTITTSTMLGPLAHQNVSALNVVSFFNSSGGNRNYGVYVVPPGGTINPGTQYGLNLLSSNNAIANFNIGELPPGTSVYCVADDATATQIFWTNVYERTP